MIGYLFYKSKETMGNQRKCRNSGQVPPHQLSSESWKPFRLLQEVKGSQLLLKSMRQLGCGSKFGYDAFGVNNFEPQQTTKKTSETANHPTIYTYREHQWAQPNNSSQNEKANIDQPIHGRQVLSLSQEAGIIRVHR